MCLQLDIAVDVVTLRDLAGLVTMTACWGSRQIRFSGPSIENRRRLHRKFLRRVEWVGWARLTSPFGLNPQPIQEESRVSMVDIHLRKLLWMYCLGHAGVKGNDRADTLAGKVTFIGLFLGKSEVLRSLRQYLRAQSQGHHTIDRLEERGVERGSARRSSLKGRQSDEHWNRFNGNFGETSERRSAVHMGFSEPIDTVLNWCEQELME